MLSASQRDGATIALVPWIEGMLATGSLTELEEVNAHYTEPFFWYPPLRCDGLLPATGWHGLLRSALAEAEAIEDHNARGSRHGVRCALSRRGAPKTLLGAARAVADGPGRHHDHALLAVVTSAYGSPAAGPCTAEASSHMETALRRKAQRRSALTLGRGARQAALPGLAPDDASALKA